MSNRDTDETQRFQDQSEADGLSQDEIIVSEAEDLPAVSLLKAPREVDSAASDYGETRGTVMHGETKSWSGDDNRNHHKGNKGTAGVSSLLRKTSNLGTTVSTISSTEPQHLESNGQQNSVEHDEHEVPSKSISNEHGNRDSNSKSQILGANGEGKKRKNGRRSNAVSKEARVKNLRWRNLKARATVSEKRRELKAARLEMVLADAKFMKLIRERRTSDGKHGDPIVLEQHYSQLQAARDKYGLLEEAYNTLEEKLDRDEYEIIQLEEQLKSNEDRPESRIDDSDFSDSSSRVFDDDESDRPTSPESGTYTLHDEYLSRLGDADLVHEDLVELKVAHQNLRELQESRGKVGLQLSPEDQATLDNYSTEKAALLEGLREIKVDAERLRIQCLEAGLLEEGDEDILSDFHSSIISEYERYPLLQEQPNGKQVGEEPESLISDSNEGNLGNRIERWLLHKLRSSCSEVELLARLSVDDGLDVQANTRKWQEDVLTFWFIDDTNLPPSAYQVQATVTEFDIPTSPFANKDSEALFNSGQAQLFELVIRSPSIFNKVEFALLLRLTIPKGEKAKSVQ